MAKTYLELIDDFQDSGVRRFIEEVEIRRSGYGRFIDVLLEKDRTISRTSGSRRYF